MVVDQVNEAPSMTVQSGGFNRSFIGERIFKEFTGFWAWLILLDLEE